MPNNSCLSSKFIDSYCGIMAIFAFLLGKNSIMPKPILSLDFDGVLHQYTGWKGHATILDDPIPGAADFCWKAQELFTLVVFSSRAAHDSGPEAIITWLDKHGFPSMEVTCQKPPAFLSIDDRSTQFTGNWDDYDPVVLRTFKPWWKE
jgi:hypothetical protein